MKNVIIGKNVTISHYTNLYGCELGWNPEYTFESMMDEMINHWINIYNK